jgi:hypothetical protein
VSFDRASGATAAESQDKCQADGEKYGVFDGENAIFNSAYGAAANFSLAFRGWLLRKAGANIVPMEGNVALSMPKTRFFKATAATGAISPCGRELCAVPPLDASFAGIGPRPLFLDQPTRASARLPRLKRRAGGIPDPK